MNAKPEKKHSKVGASSAYRWFECPGSVKAIARLPVRPQKSYHADEGTAAHELAEACLRNNRDAIEYIDRQFGEFTVDEDMASAVQVYLDVIRCDLSISDPAKLYIEEGFDLFWLHPELFGTNDACIVQPFGILRVYDYKHGKGIAVDVEDNKQLLYYALGAASRFEYAFEEVEIIIVQPRAPHRDGPVRRWKTTIPYLKQFKDRLHEAVKETEKKDAGFKAGEHCRFCAAASTCKTYETHVHSLAKLKFSPVTEAPELPAPKDMDPAHLRKILETAHVLDHWIREVEAYALDEALRGRKVDGFKLVRKGTHRRWKDKEETAKGLSGKYGDKIYKPREILSPAQMEKIVGRGQEKILERYWEQPEGALVLAPETDKRMAITVNPIELVFDKIT